MFVPTKLCINKACSFCLTLLQKNCFVLISLHLESLLRIYNCVNELVNGELSARELTLANVRRLRILHVWLYTCIM